VATAAQFNTDMRDNLIYLWGGDGSLGSEPQYVNAIGQVLGVAFNTLGIISMTSIYSTTYSSPSTGTAVPLTEAGVYLVAGYVEALPLTSVGGVTGCRIHLNGTAIQGTNQGWYSPFNSPPTCNPKRLVKLAAAGTLSMAGLSQANSATTDMFGGLQAERLA